jgi:hypothetical protein
MTYSFTPPADWEASEPHEMKYLRYIRNTGRAPLPVATFDEDWEPVGPKVRRHLVELGAITEAAGGIFLTDRGRAYAALPPR